MAPAVTCSLICARSARGASKTINTTLAAKLNRRTKGDSCENLDDYMGRPIRGLPRRCSSHMNKKTRALPASSSNRCTLARSQTRCCSLEETAIRHMMVTYQEGQIIKRTMMDERRLHRQHSVCPSVRPSVRPFVCLSVSVCRSVGLSAGLSVCPSVCLSVHPSVHPSVRLSLSLFQCVRVCPCVPVRLSVCLRLCLTQRLQKTLFKRTRQDTSQVVVPPQATSPMTN